MPDRTPRPPRVRLLVLVAAVLVAATAVGAVVVGAVVGGRSQPAGDAAGDAAGDPVEVDLSATARLPRLVHHPRTVDILVTNHGAEPVRVREVELVTESFAATGPVEKDVVIPADGARALSISYGEARCGGEAAPPPAPASARLVLAGVPEPVELDLPQPEDRLALLLRNECAAELVARAVEVGFGEWSSGPDGVLHGSLVVERRDGEVGGEPVTVVDLAGNVLYKVVAEDPAVPIGVLPPGERRLEIPVVADANRCTGHAVGEAKRRFEFPAWVSIGADENLPIILLADHDSDQFEAMLRVRCDL